MSSGDYWKKREQEAKKETIRDEEEYRKRIETIYKQTYEAVERQINDWYARYASKNGLSMSEARMRVKKLDMERYERIAAKYVATHDFSDQANEEMEIYNLTMRINRLELLKAQINLELLAGYDDLDKELEREFIEQAMKEDRRLAGILGDSVIGNQKYAKHIVNASFWNATYSERIWGNNMPRLRSSIETQLRNGIIQGIHPTELARKLRQSFDVSVRDSERLMITEVRRIQTEIQKDSFDRNGFKEYRFISAGDGRVCPECERLHGQHFKISEMQPGENAPPMHPVCRCSTAAWMDGEKYKRWLDALERGEDVRWKEFEANEERVYTGIPKSWRKNEQMSDDIALRGTNPKFTHNLPRYLAGTKEDYTNNCTNCVVAYSQRCKGYDVTARSVGENKKLQNGNMIFSAWKDREPTKAKGTGFEEISEYLSTCENGALVAITVDMPKTIFNKSQGHAFVAENKRGKVLFLDPQSGKIYNNPKKIFETVALDGTMYMRVDDLELSDRGVTACRAV